MDSKSKPKIKTNLHPRNKNREPYDLEILKKESPKLVPFIRTNPYGNESIDFSNPQAVKILNQALLSHYYGIKKWDFPNENLCPPIPGRADYLHYIADLLAESNGGKIPLGSNIKGLDIGTGATCIYPILGVAEYDWNFIASDIDKASIQNANQILKENNSLKDKIEIRIQPNSDHIFKGVLSHKEQITFSMCNPPFHLSKEDAIKGSMRKIKNLTGKSTGAPKLNFSGNFNELIYKGGEASFIKKMISESLDFANNCQWFTTLVSKENNLTWIEKQLDKIGAKDVRIIAMETGNKKTRVIAWTFL
ncbi:MAG: 23S rRNA (adenine(1618)-N(6))-methyltransferase RlmF [Saprospiraceae bacterium]